ncbi:MAG TPA: MarR family transcriptional regulator, partial [Rhodothermales bacterium]
MLIGTNLKYTKAHNLRIVLETIRLHGPLSRAEIARRTALTAQTITNITRKLFDRDLIRETHRAQEGRGAPSTMLALHA